MSEAWTDDSTPAVDEAQGPVEPTDPDAAPTGHAVVDEVLTALDGLEDRPVAEHVAVFESGHDRLREALADAGTAGTPTQEA